MLLRSDYDHRYKPDLLRLAEDLDGLTDKEKQRVIIMTLEAGLMRARGLLRFGIIVISWVRGKSMLHPFLKEWFRRDPTAARTLWQNTMDHMVNGRDAYDRNSAGGWCRAELAKFVEICRSVAAVSERIS